MRQEHGIVERQQRGMNRTEREEEGGREGEGEACLRLLTAESRKPSCCKAPDACQGVSGILRTERGHAANPPLRRHVEAHRVHMLPRQEKRLECVVDRAKLFVLFDQLGHLALERLDQRAVVVAAPVPVAGGRGQDAATTHTSTHASPTQRYTQIRRDDRIPHPDTDTHISHMDRVIKANHSNRYATGTPTDRYKFAASPVLLPYQVDHSHVLRRYAHACGHDNMRSWWA